MPLARRGAGLGGYRSSAMLQKRYILIGVYIHIYIYVYTYCKRRSRVPFYLELKRACRCTRTCSEFVLCETALACFKPVKIRLHSPLVAEPSSLSLPTCTGAWRGLVRAQGSLHQCKTMNWQHLLQFLKAALVFHSGQWVRAELVGHEQKATQWDHCATSNDCSPQVITASTSICHTCHRPSSRSSSALFPSTRAVASKHLVHDCGRPLFSLGNEVALDVVRDCTKKESGCPPLQSPQMFQRC